MQLMRGGETLTPLGANPAEPLLSRDPSLRLKNGSAQDDATSGKLQSGISVRRRRHCSKASSRRSAFFPADRGISNATYAWGRDLDPSRCESWPGRCYREILRSA